MDTELRNRGIIFTGAIGIVANIVLAVSKALVGFFVNSIAIIMDAVNNLSDAASAVITIVGTKLATKKPDKKHPFGHGRFEYLSAMLIAVLVLYAGLSALVESVKKILSPEKPNYSKVSLVIVFVAVIVKIALGLFVKSRGKKYNSSSLVNSGQDALLDSIISVSTLIAAFIFIFTGLSLEAWLGTVISILVIKSGYEMISKTISALLGERVDPKLAREIKETINSFKDVKGTYDLVLNNYGPDYFNGSVHIEVPDTYTADRIDELVRNIQIEVFTKYKIILTAIGVYSYNTKDEEAIKLRTDVLEITGNHKNVLQVHGFYLNKETKTIRFDVVISFDSKNRYAEFEEIVSEVQKKYPEYKIISAIDTDYSELDS